MHDMSFTYLFWMGIHPKYIYKSVTETLLT